jgi:hypothetical protein
MLPLGLPNDFRHIVFYHVHFTPLTPNASSNQNPRPIDINCVVLDLAKVEANLEYSKKCKKCMK